MARLASVTGAFLLLALCHVTMSITVEEFFPDIKKNLTILKWSHGTNDKAALDKALNSTEIQVIEADVVMGKMTGASATDLPIPIMAHPPAITSDISLKQFIDGVLVHKTKGVKLDFKSIDAFTSGMEILLQNNTLTQLTKIPVWLNADILNGPVNAIGAVDAKVFLETAAKLPQAILSVGWTTKLENNNATTQAYTVKQINQMEKLIIASNVSQSVTYPVRACFAANDFNGFKTLLANTSSRASTLTIWSSEGDAVNTTLLSEMILDIGVEKVYVDVPASVYAQLKLTDGKSSAFTAKSSLIILLASMIVALVGSKLL